VLLAARHVVRAYGPWYTPKRQHKKAVIQVSTRHVSANTSGNKGSTCMERVDTG
jgi:hypothetical protein